MSVRSFEMLTLDYSFCIRIRQNFATKFEAKSLMTVVKMFTILFVQLIIRNILGKACHTAAHSKKHNIHDHLTHSRQIIRKYIRRSKRNDFKKEKKTLITCLLLSSIHITHTLRMYV